jgi:hypothetical protein
VKTDQSNPTIWLAPFSRDELCEEPGDAETQKRRERLMDSFSGSRRDFCPDGKNKKTCTKQV